MMNLSSCPIIGGILTEINAEDLQTIDESVKYRKQLLREEYESKQRQLAAKWILKKKRVANLEKLRSIKKTELIAKNRAHRQQVQLRLDKIKTIEFYKKLNLEINFMRKHKKTVANISNLKRSKLKEKREREWSRCWKIFNAQKLEMANEKTLIDTENKVKENILATLNIPKVNTQHAGEVETFEHSFNHSFVDRTEKFKMNFNTYEQGIAFLENTQPVWDRMTQCLVEKSISSVPQSTLEVVYMDESPKLSEDVLPTKEDEISLIQILYKDTATEINYNLSNDSVIEMVKRAKLLLDSDAIAADVMHLTRCIIEDELDINTNVNSMVHSLIERSVFEYSKIQIAKRIFSHARKSIDRLQHVNENDLIPRNNIMFDDKKDMASAVHELIVNDKVYGLFDQPTDDEPDYDALGSETVAERMQRVVQNDGETELQSTPSLFPLNERRELLEIVDQTVTSFLDTVDCTIAMSVSTNRINKFADAKYIKSKATMLMAYRIGRKLTKLMFGMFPTEERRLYNVKKAYVLYRDLVVNRTPPIVYEYNKLDDKTQLKKAKVEVDFSYLQKLLEDLDPWNRGTSSIKI